jgi:hypothetical protein
MSVMPFITSTATYHKHYKNVKPAKPCRRVALSVLAENFVAVQEDNTNRETK